MKTKIHPHALLSATRGWLLSHRRLVIAASLVMLAGFMTLGLLRTSLSVRVSYQADDIAVDAPFEVSLSQNLRQISLESIVVLPDASGTWEHQRGTLIDDDKLVFHPQSDLKVATTYTVRFPKAARMLVGASDIPSVTFDTETAPSLLDTGLMTIDDGAVIAADFEPSVELKGKNRNLRKLELRTKPSVSMTQSSYDDQKFTWKPKKHLTQSKSIRFELVDTKNNVVLAKKTLKVAAEPSIAKPVKSNHFTPNDSAKIVFSQPIKPDQKKYIIFGTKGSGGWKNNTTYEFKPQSLKPGVTYAYSVKKGFRSIEGGILTRDLKHTFSTTGPVVVSNMAPWGDGLSQAEQTLRFTFDQTVDKSSAVSRLKISHGKLAGIRWQGNTMLATVRKLGYQKQVTATLSPGVKNAGFGAPSNRAYSVTFTTEARTIRLNVPYYRQQHEATCTAAALRMALGYRGVSSGEMDLVRKMGYKPRAMNKSKKPAVWDDPAQMFVGSVDGYIRGGTGAGPDAPPVAKAARSSGRSASVHRSISAGWIAQQIHAGNPVIMFGSTLNTGNISWKTPSGGTATMNLTGHVTVVTGVVGEPHAPLGFYVHDPYRTSSYWSVDAVAANISRDPYGQAVVVY